MRPFRLAVTALFACALTLLAIAAGRHLRQPSAGDSAPVAADTGAPPAPAEPARLEMVHTIAAGETIGAILPRYGAPVEPVLAAARPVADLARIRAGRDLVFVMRSDSAVPVEIRYPLDRDRTLVIDRDGETWSARLDEVRYDHRIGERAFTIRSSLWAAATEAGLSPGDIATLARVFEYDIDFNTELRAGASARMVVDELWQGEAFARLGAPLAVRLDNDGRSYVAVRFRGLDGKVGYYDPDGVARRKAFLRSPLAFSRVTSGFSRSRYHPILKRRRAHLGVDFGAPAGTPVRAVGEGRVVYAGRNGGHGNFVKIDHPGPYASSYSHLSRILVKRGQHVDQGQVIGRVGSTGLATGPHLHFQFWVGGRIVNPLTVDLPRETRLEGAELAAFRSLCAAILPVLDGIAEAEPPADSGAEPAGETSRE